MQTTEDVTLIRLPEVIARTGLSQTTIYRMATEGRFPRPVKTGDGPRAAAMWPKHEIDNWIKKLIATRTAEYAAQPLDKPEWHPRKRRKAKAEGVAA